MSAALDQQARVWTREECLDRAAVILAAAMRQAQADAARLTYVSTGPHIVAKPTR